MKISIVIPVYQAEKTILSLVDELMSRLSCYELEIILVNDGSTDNSGQACASIFKKYRKAVKYINLSRNFGEHNAVLAGLNYAGGDYAVIIDDDFQNPPEEIGKLIDEAVRGRFDVVYGYYGKKCHSPLRNIGSRFANFIAGYLLDKPKGLYLSSFKCLSRFTVAEIIKYKGPFVYIDGLILRTTQNIGKTEVRHEARAQGRSGYTFRKLVRLWLNMFVNFSIYPLRMSTLLGFLFSVIGGCAALYLIIDKIIHPEIPAGITSIIISILIFSGIQLIILGLIGEYIGKQYLTANQAPQYVVREVLAEGVKDEKNCK